MGEGLGFRPGSVVYQSAVAPWGYFEDMLGDLDLARIIVRSEVRNYCRESFRVIHFPTSWICFLGFFARAFLLGRLVYIEVRPSAPHIAALLFF